MGIKIGNLDIASLKLGSADVTAYLGDVLIYSGGTPPQPTSAKWIATYTGGTTDSAACDSSSAITGSEITLTDLESVVIGDCVTSIGASAFTTGAVYNTLSSVTIPVSVTSIGNAAFFASKLVSVEIPNSVTTIGDYAFGGVYNGTGNTALTTAVIGSGVTSFGSGVFGCQDNIQSITIYATTPPTIVSGNRIFYKSNGFDIPENLVIYVPSESVDAYKSASGWSTYADRIQAIFKWSIVNNGNEVVYTGACNSSSTYSSADTLDYVALVEAGGSDYYDADSIEFGNCVTSIAYDCLTDGNGNYIGYNYIKTIIIPNSVNYIADEAFINTPGNEDIICYATTPPTLGGLDAFGSFAGTIYVPDEALSDYQNDSDWSYFDVKALSDRMNYRFKLIDEFDGEYISDCDPGLTSVSTDDDFANANYTYTGTPVEIYVGDCAETVDDDTFSGATGLSKVVLGKNIYEIGSCAFCSTNESFILICLAGTPPTLTDHIFDAPNGGIYVPDDSVDAYKEASIWSDYAQGIFPISDLPSQ